MLGILDVLEDGLEGKKRIQKLAAQVVREWALLTVSFSRDNGQGDKGSASSLQQAVSHWSAS
jgi:hypothetical protein